MTATPPPPLPPPNALRMARTGLIVLTFINLFNYIDRYVVPSLFESLKHSELAPSDKQLGLTMTVFLIVYTLAAPVFGRLGDKRSRPRLLAVGVLLWSIATTLAGFSRSVVQLLGARALVGVGEAAYGTVGPSLLADYYPRVSRGRAFTIFFIAIPVGSALGYMVGGLVDHAFGWRRAFFVAGIPGLLLAWLALRLWDAPRGAHDQAPAAKAKTHILRALFENRAYRLTVLGYAAYTFALGGVAAWMASFLSRVRGLPMASATVRFGGIVVLTGLLGTWFGGRLADRLLARTREAYLWMSGVATLIAAPLFAIALISPVPAVYWSAMILAQLLMFASTGPINAHIANVVRPEIRATAVAASIFTIHALGDVPSPFLVGAISDARSLGLAVLILPVAALIAGCVWSWGALSRASPSP